MPIPVLWAVASCLLSGALAAALGLDGMFSRVSPFIDYAVPHPFSFGLFHVPSLVLGAAALYMVDNRPAAAQSLFRHVCAGLAIAGLIQSWNVGQTPLRSDAMSLYIVVDGITLLAFSTLLRRAPGRPWMPARTAYRLAGLVAPVALTTLHPAWSGFGASNHEFITRSTDPTGNIETIHLALNRRVRPVDDECRAVVQAAPTFLGRSGHYGERPDRLLMFFVHESHAHYASGTPPVVEYTVSPEGGDHCRSLRLS